MKSELRPSTPTSENRLDRAEALFWLIVSIIWLVNYWLKVEYLFGLDFEEVRNGLYPMGVGDRLSWNPWLYQYQFWGHGPVVFGALMIPFYWMFGPTALGLKAVAALFAFGGCAAWTLVIRRHWGRNAAVLLGVWWLLPPPFLEYSWHRAWANHMESLFFMGWIVWTAFPAKRLERTLIRRFALGTLCGFACFFCLQNLVAVAAVVLILVWDDLRAGLIRFAWPMLPGYALGVVPHFLSPFSWFGMRSFAPVGRSAATNLSDLLLTALPIFAGYSPVFWSAVFFVAGLVGLAAMAWDARRRQRRVGAAGSDAPDTRLIRYWPLYSVLFVAAYLLSPFKMDFPASEYWHRYLVPLFPPLMGGLVYLSVRFRRVGVALVLILVVVSVPVQIARIRTVAENRNHRESRTGITGLRGDDMLFFLKRNYVNLARPNGLADAIVLIDKLPVPWRPAAWVILGAEQRITDVAGAMDWASGLPESERALFAQGVGQLWFQQRSGRDEGAWTQETRGHYRVLADESRVVASGFLRGVGDAFAEQFKDSPDNAALRDFASFLADPNDPLHEGEGDFWFGVGRQNGLRPDKQEISPYSRRLLAPRGADTPEDRPGWLAGYWDGSALLYMNTYDRVVVDWDATEDWSRLSAAIRATGATLTPVDGHPHEYRIGSHRR